MAKGKQRIGLLPDGRNCRGCKTQFHPGAVLIENPTFADFCRACADVSHLANEMDVQAVLITRGPLLPLSNLVRVTVTPSTPRGRRPYAQLRRGARVVKRRPHSK